MTAKKKITMLPKSIIPRQSLQAEVVSRLRDEIIEGVWEPGARLQERRMCERYGISRSPLREAYHVLAIEGLLELLPSRGAVVTAPTKEDSMQHYTLSKALEILGLELACDNATEDELDNIEFLHRKMQRLCEKKDLPGLLKINNEIHRAIVCASGNIPLIHTHLIIARHIIRIQNLNGAIEHSTEDAFAQHEAFMAPFLKRDKAKAVSAFKKHLSTVGNNLQQRLDTAFYVD